jgi:fatty-acyl-CoA synthase
MDESITSVTSERPGTGDAAPTSVLRLFADRAATQPERQVLFEVAFDGPQTNVKPFSWSDIFTQTRRAASALDAAGVKAGDRVALCVAGTSRFLAYFLGAQALGAVPVPLPSAGEMRAREAFRDRIDSVFADCLPTAIVVDSTVDRDSLDAARTRGAAVIDGSEPGPEALGLAPFSVDRSADETAYLQYTSGSTGAPKGVVVTHRNLVANLTAIAAGADLGPTDRGFTWLPLYHDMGLIGGLLLGLFVDGDVHAMPTKAFIGRPALWLRGMSEFKATFASAPNFAFSLVARHMREEAVAQLDLSHWRRAFNGAEPIDHATLDAFAHRFAPASFRLGTMCPVYGLAESTLAVSIPAPDASPRYDLVDRDVLVHERKARPSDENSGSSVCFVSVGRVVPAHSVCIVDPATQQELGERCIGEVTVTGPSVTPYYFRADGRYEPPRQTLRTGDLGYIAEGELYIVDRLKDLLIVAGRNIVPSDVERVVAQVPGIRYGAVVAFGIRGTNGTEDLYVVAGAEPRALQDSTRRDAVRAAVSRHFGVVPREVVLVQPNLIPKTSSGKVRRAACRDLYELGALSAKAAPATAS